MIKISIFFKSDEGNDTKTGNAMKFPEYYIII
jgi:hypothetical protein